MLEIVGDSGSCHGGDLKGALRCIDAAAEAGLKLVKLQLFPALGSGANIPLSPAHIKPIKKYADSMGIQVFASVWDDAGMAALYNAGCKRVKFAYSQRNSRLLHTACSQFDEVYVSMDLTDSYRFLDPKITRLYVVALYPLVYTIDFTGIFPRMHGFSDHSIAPNNARAAVLAGAEVIECHFKCDDPAACPDAEFAKDKYALREYIQEVTDVYTAARGKRHDGETVQQNTDTVGDKECQEV